MVTMSDELAGPKKFRRRAEARPDEVLDAALDLFMEKGFALTRMEDVARRAGISKGTVYLYFASKEAVLEALVRRALLPVANSALTSFAQAEGDPRETLTRVMRMLGQRLSDPRTLAIPKLIMREVIHFPELAAMYRREVLDRVIPNLTALLQRGIDEGYLRQVNAELTVRSIVGPVMLHILLSEVFGVQPKDGPEMDKLIDNHIAVLFDGLSRREDQQ